MSSFTDSNIPSSNESLQDSQSDQELLEQFAQGNDEAATMLYQRYARRVRGLIQKKVSGALSHRLEPEDLLQSVFRSFFRRSATTLYRVPGEEDLWKLLLVITLNKLRDAEVHCRAQKRDVRCTQSLDALLPGGLLPTLGDDRLLTELILTVDELVGHLPYPDNRIVEQRILGCDLTEIAASVGRSTRTVERALKHFREALQARI